VEEGLLELLTRNYPQVVVVETLWELQQDVRLMELG
jgi:hypothetical protein